MLTDLYQEYLYLVGRLKDGFGLHVDADHREIHTFYRNKVPLFKLLFGTYTEGSHKEVVVSFHIELPTVEAIKWYMNIRALHPLVKFCDVHYEDSAGEMYYGEDAEKLLQMKIEQNVLKHYLENCDKEEIKQIAESKIVGRIRDPHKTFNAETELNQAVQEFQQMKKPITDGEVQ